MKQIATMLFAIGLGCAATQGAEVAHYTFDNDLTTDSGPNGLSLTAAGDPVLVPGKFCSAVDLDGNDYLWNSSSLLDVFGGDGDGAIAFWYKSDLVSVNVLGPLVSKQDTNGDNGYTSHIRTGIVVADLFDQGTGEIVSTARPAGDTTAFQHVVFQRVGSTIELYVNSVLASTDASGGPTTTANAFSIGARNIGSGGAINSSGQSFFVDGKVDDVRIFDEPLSQAEIDALFAGPDDCDGDGSPDSCDGTPCPTDAVVAALCDEFAVTLPTSVEETTDAVEAAVANLVASPCGSAGTSACVADALAALGL